MLLAKKLVPGGRSKDRCLIASLVVAGAVGDGGREWSARSGWRCFRVGANGSEIALPLHKIDYGNFREPLRQHLQTVVPLSTKWFPQFRVPYLKFHPTPVPLSVGLQG
jgi:hypothetical protein